MRVRRRPLRVPTTIAGDERSAAPIGHNQPRADPPIGIPEAPVTGAMYGRRNATWRGAVAIDGANMQGALLLHSTTHADDLEAISKKWLEDHSDVDAGTY